LIRRERWTLQADAFGMRRLEGTIDRFLRDTSRGFIGATHYVTPTTARRRCRESRTRARDLREAVGRNLRMNRRMQSDLRPHHSETGRTSHIGSGPRPCENSISFGRNAVRSTNFCVYSFSVRPHASKIMVRFYRAEFSHSLGQELPSFAFA
jgi:hypothetical protein